MRRLLPLVAIVGVATVATSGCSSMRADAFRVGETSVSQATFDNELALLHDHPIVPESILQRRLGALPPGSLPAPVTNVWANIRIQAVFAARALERLHVPVTKADRKAVGLPSAGPYAGLPGSLRRAVTGNLAAIGVLKRYLAAKDPAVITQARASCPSGRFVAHLLVKTLAEANAIKSLLDQGRDFGTLVKANSIDTSTAGQDGQLGCLDDQKGLAAPFAAAAAALPIGTVSDPVQTQFGFHLIKVTDQPPQTNLDAAALVVMQQRLRHADVSVDPRYGRWDATKGQLVAPRTLSG